MEWAYRVTVGYSAEDEVVVLRDLSLITALDRVTLDPSSSPQDALLVALAQAMKLHLSGVNFGKLHGDLIAAGMGVEVANCVHDHLMDISVEEWNRLKERIIWYRDDKCLPITGSSKAAGTT